jgi:hypothetical protein
VEVRQRGDRDADRERRGVELVVRVQGEDRVEDPRDLGGRGPAVEQVKEVGGGVATRRPPPG